MDSREDPKSNTARHTAFDLPFSADSSYSRDRNLWHISHEGLELEDPAKRAQLRIICWFLGCHSRRKLPTKAEYVTMTFEKGVPKTRKR